MECSAEGILDQAKIEIKKKGEKRDIEGKRSMAKTVDAFNAFYADMIRANDGWLTEELGWQFMSLVKKARGAANGYEPDSHVDDAAFCGLAGEARARER